MAVRRIARTVVEGGRGSWSKYERRLIAGQRRRNWITDEDGEPYQRKAPLRSYPEFADRLKAFRRWLESHAGEQWDAIYSKFCRENDRRTMKGWHLWTHLISMVCCTGLEDSSPYSNYGRMSHRDCCAASGSLVVTPRNRYRYSAPIPKGEREAVATWTKGRKVLVSGAEAFWSKGVFKVTPPLFRPDLSVFAQGDRLTKDEAAYFWSLHKETRDGLVYKKARR